MMRWISLLLLAAITVLAPAPAAAQLPGTYRLTQIEHRELPAPSAGEDGVMVRAGALVLSEDGRYTFEMTATAQGAAPETASIAGSYRAENGELVLQTDGAEESQRLRYSLEGEELTLLDEAGETYTFVRQ